MAPPAKPGSIEAAADKGDATIGSVHARSLLAGLNLDTAIRLRWALRDIRADSMVTGQPG